MIISNIAQQNDTQENETETQENDNEKNNYFKMTLKSFQNDLAE